MYDMFKFVYFVVKIIAPYTDTGYTLYSEILLIVDYFSSFWYSKNTSLIYRPQEPAISCVTINTVILSIQNA